MIIFKVLKNLYCNKSSTWINDLTKDEETEIQPFLVQKWLSMNPIVSKQTRILDKYTFNVSTKMYLSFAWSILPKYNITPKVSYIKKIETENKYEYIIKCFRQQLELSDNDFKVSEPYILKDIETNKVKWFKYYGVEKKEWTKAGLDFKEMKKSDVVKEKSPQIGLSAWA